MSLVNHEAHSLVYLTKAVYILVEKYIRTGYINDKKIFTYICIINNNRMLRAGHNQYE